MALGRQRDKATTAETSDKPVKKPQGWTKPLRAFGGYFKGAWKELRQVRWPGRRATWSLTLAVILFSAFFAVVILGLDYVFNYLFQEVLL
ncbi:MAG TPA: preprotein translocase subunit SecE [Candidatus Saccharimonadales bacterium]